MSPDLALPAETYRAIYRGSTVVLGIGSNISDATATEIADHAKQIRKGNIGVRVHTVHLKTHHQLQTLLPPDVLAARSFHHSKDDVPEMLRRITETENEPVEEIVVFSGHRIVATNSKGKPKALPLLAQTEFDGVIGEHPEEEELLSAVSTALSRTPRVVLTSLKSLGSETRSINGKGTMCFDSGAIQYGPLYAYELPIFERIHEQDIRNGTRERVGQEHTKARGSHFVFRAGRMPVAGCSMIERGQGRMSADLMWGCSPRGNLGPLLLQRVTEEADRTRCSCSVITTRLELARLLGSHPDIQDLGTISSLKGNGQIEKYAPEHRDRDTTNHDPRVFWYQGKH